MQFSGRGSGRLQCGKHWNWTPLCVLQNGHSAAAAARRLRSIFPHTQLTAFHTPPAIPRRDHAQIHTIPVDPNRCTFSHTQETATKKGIFIIDPGHREIDGLARTLAHKSWK